MQESITLLNPQVQSEGQMGSGQEYRWISTALFEML